MKAVLKLEELVQFGFGIYLFSLLHFQWWWFLVLILSPDIGMLGYLFGNKAGAALYNIFHHKGVAMIIYLIGVYGSNSILQLIG
ncbi:MAG: DUF4260 family protein, partial [Bacteroidota bacterium]